MSRSCTALVILLLTWPLPRAVGGGIESLRGQRIAEIRFEGEGLSESEGLKYVDIRAGDRFSRRSVRHSIELLYYLGIFGGVQAVAMPNPSGEGLVLVFKLAPKRTVLSVAFLGNDAVEDEGLRRLSRLKRGDEYDQWQMKAAATDILSLYKRSGYRRARIVPKAEGPADGDVNVRYYIQEGPPTRISRIWFKGQFLFAPERLKDVMDLDRGDVLDAQSLERGVGGLREFYRQNDYLEVQISEPRPEFELAAMWEVVPIEIETGPRITFHFEGNQVLKSDALAEEIKVDEDVTYNPFMLDDLSQRLAELYHRQGFARAKVDYRIEFDESENHKQITFLVEEGNRVTVKEIRFEGNHAFPDEELRKYVFNEMLDAIPQSLVNQPVDRGDIDQLAGSHPMTGEQRRINRPQGFLFELVPETVYLREPYELALEKIADRYRSSGYLEVEIEAPILSYDSSGSSLYVTVPVKEGRRTLVESISFAGNHSFSSSSLFEVADRLTGLVRPGQALNLYGVEQLRRELVQYYADKGYIFCRVEQRVVYSDDRSLGEVVFEFDEGPQVKVGRILVRGDVVTDPAVFEHSLTIKTGEVFSPRKVLKSREKLYDLEIFTGVDIKVLDQDLVEEEKDVVVTVRERLPHSIVVSPGISSAEGVRLQLDYTHRNLFGYALEFVGKAKVNYLVFYPLDENWEDRYQEMSFFEGLEGLLLTGVHWPRVWLTDLDLSARIDLFALQDHASSHDLQKFSLTPGVDLKLTDDLSFSGELELEYDRLGCIKEECGGPTQKYLRYDEGSLLLGLIRPKLSWDARDNLFRPHRGSLVTLNTELAGNLLPDKEVLYLKVDGTATGYVPLGRSVTLALSLRAGFIFNLTDGSRTPSHKLFWLGGRNTVRGFGEEGLIPADQRNPDNTSTPCVPDVDEEGRLRCISLGGNALLLLKGELRFPLIPGTLEGAVFVDVGNLWVEPANIDPFDLRPTAGVGTRIITPVGPIAFDLAFNLNPDPARREEIWNLHFNIGVF